MPFIAKNQDEHITPEEAEKSDELTCPKCNGELTIRQSFKRKGSFVARHFMHVSGHSSSNGGSSGCGGESDKHEKMKSVVLSKLKNLYNVKRSEYEASINTRSGRRRTDALVEFEEAKANLGKGIAAEVQHKNESKDIAKVTSDICGAGYTVLWVEEDAIDGKDVDIQKCDIRNPFPDGVPSRKQWRPPSSLSTKEPQQFGTRPKLDSEVRLKMNPMENCVRLPYMLIAEDRQELPSIYESENKDEEWPLKDALYLDFDEGYLTGESLYLIWRAAKNSRNWGNRERWEPPSMMERIKSNGVDVLFSGTWSTDKVVSQLGLVDIEDLCGGGLPEFDTEAELGPIVAGPLSNVWKEGWQDGVDSQPWGKTTMVDPGPNFGSIKQACDEGEHSIRADEDDYKICVECGVTTQALKNWLGQEI